MSEFTECLKLSLETGFIDEALESSDEFRPKLLINDHKKGSKVINHLVKEMEACKSFSFSVAFITLSGLTILLNTLKELDGREIKGKILTTDYLYFNDPRAFEKLLEFKNLEVKIYTKSNFHAKGYIFHKNEEISLIVGSSNITQEALTLNKEWNIKLSSLKQGELVKNTVAEFDEMWKDAEILTDEWIQKYRVIFQEQKKAQIPVIFDPANFREITPNKMQNEALASLNSIRQNNKNKALLISATGTGKTYLSAFDVKAFKPKKFLFVVHRGNIITQAIKSFKHVLGNNIKIGRFSGNQADLDFDYLFVTIQMMSKPEYYKLFSKDYFDYIVIDEVHRAGACSYIRILDYFKPKFYLGMTATPERMDGFNIFKLFDYNIAYEIRLQDALEEDLLCPFHYFGVSEIKVNNNLLSDEMDFSNLVSHERVNNIIKKTNFYGYCGERVKGLVFCSRVDEARELSVLFNRRGYNTICLSGDDNEDVREDAISRLEADDGDDMLDYIFSVDVFNEGIDIPSINQVVMLRPTQSAIIFVQQLGRGLRKSYDKDFLVVIDFIGNYKNNFLIPVALSGDRTYNRDTIRRYVIEGNSVIPGCSTINFDEISKEKIFDSISSANLNSMIFLKNEYIKLKNKLGEIPTVCEFYEHDSIDPQLIFSKNNLKCYYNFLKYVEGDAYPVNISSIGVKYLEYLSAELSNGKRPHEMIILCEVIKNGFCRIADISAILEEKYQIFKDEKSIISACKLLEGEFLSETVMENKYGNVKFIETKKDIIDLSVSFRKELTNGEFLSHILDIIKYSQIQYENIYENDDKFKLYKKYSRKDVCRLLNWEKNNESTIYGYRIKNNTCPIFVTYEKSEDINESTKYDDRFINKKEFSWMTRSRVKLDSREATEIINSDKNGLEIYLFVKKDDDEGSDFYYIGKVKPNKAPIQKIIENDNREKLPIVNFNFEIESVVREDIYDYFTKKSPKSC